MQYSLIIAYIIVLCALEYVLFVAPSFMFTAMAVGVGIVGYREHKRRKQ